MSTESKQPRPLGDVSHISQDLNAIINEMRRFSRAEKTVTRPPKAEAEHIRQEMKKVFSLIQDLEVKPSSTDQTPLEIEAKVERIGQETAKTLSLIQAFSNKYSSQTTGSVGIAGTVKVQTET